MKLYFRLKDCYNMALTPEETAILKDLKKERRVDIIDIQTYACVKIAKYYNKLLREITYTTKADFVIYDREYIESQVKEQDYRLFDCLKYSGLLTVCGAGYQFSSNKLKIEEFDLELYRKVKQRIKEVKQQIKQRG